MSSRLPTARYRQKLKLSKGFDYKTGSFSTKDFLSSGLVLRRIVLKRRSIKSEKG